MSFALLPIVAAQLGSLLIAGRVAIVVSAGAADGQAPLRYAERDADRVATVLRELGGFTRVNQLRDPSPAALRDALAETEALAARDPGLEVIFYYSGHADTQGLLMGPGRFPFDELRSRLEHSRAAVRVALLDACYSGSIVRPKGGKPAPGYALDTVEPPRVHGAAIIAAGTASELAQESGDIEGSYFTHHVLSAPRSADSTWWRRRCPASGARSTRRTNTSCRVRGISSSRASGAIARRCRSRPDRGASMSSAPPPTR